MRESPSLPRTRHRHWPRGPARRQLTNGRVASGWVARKFLWFPADSGILPLAFLFRVYPEKVGLRFVQSKEQESAVRPLVRPFSTQVGGSMMKCGGIVRVSDLLLGGNTSSSFNVWRKKYFVEMHSRMIS